jgi:hypothetical protein
MIKRSSTLVYVTRGLLAFEGAENFPSRWAEGNQVDTRLRLFGFLPAWRHRLQVARVDDNRRVIQTLEGGGFITKWDHRIEVEEAGAGTRYVDDIDVEAGSFTVPVLLYAKALYRYRQRRLQQLVAQMRRNG